MLLHIGLEVLLLLLELFDLEFTPLLQLIEHVPLLLGEGGILKVLSLVPRPGTLVLPRCRITEHMSQGLHLLLQSLFTGTHSQCSILVELTILSVYVESTAESG
jgi:hypothetical protein